MLDWVAHLPPGTDPTTVDLGREISLPRSWTARWAEDPNRRTLFDDVTGWVDADELEARTRRIATRFAGIGLVPGDRLLLSAAPSVHLAVAHVAALRLGLVVVPANTSYRRREVAHLVADARPAAAVVDDHDRATWVEAASGARPIVVVGPEVDLPDGGGADRLDASSADDPALLVYTSGTTGTPKGAVLSHGNLLASAEALRLAWRWTPDDRLVLPLPLFHLHGLGVGLHGTLTAGASAVIRPGFDTGDTLDAVAAHGATLLFGVPTMWRRISSSGRAGELAALRLGVSGSAPLDTDLHRTLADQTGHALIERYGMTETVMNVSTPYDGERRAGTVGLPLPGVEVRLAVGTDEILVRGPNVFHGYWDRPDATTASFSGDWFHTGDIGAWDGDGYLRIIGRSKELIISGGYNVYPREVEDVLRAHPEVVDVAVVGAADTEWGERVVAVVEGDEGATTRAELHELAASGLAPHKRPKAVVFVDSLPRNALGKVLRAEVASLVR